MLLAVLELRCQWDIRTGTVVQEYPYHLAPVNTVTFADDGRRFVSTSVRTFRDDGIFCGQCSDYMSACVVFGGCGADRTTRRCWCGTTTRPCPSSTSASRTCTPFRTSRRAPMVRRRSDMVPACMHCVWLCRLPVALVVHVGYEVGVCDPCCRRVPGGPVHGQHHRDVRRPQVPSEFQEDVQGPPQRGLRLPSWLLAQRQVRLAQCAVTTKRRGLGWGRGICCDPRFCCH